MANLYDKIDRVRKPRVHIKYEIETEGGSVEKELPFVVGVLGDFSGNAGDRSKPFNERKFIQIDRDNFDDVMRNIAPAVTLRVPNMLKNDDTELPVTLNFTKMADFEPAAIVDQVPELKKLLAIRNMLRDLMSKADLSAELENILENILQDKDCFEKLIEELKTDPADNQNTPKLTSE
ncbi:type VI secretion system contractile sheath small subunit [Pseudochrobactrum sp. HB0163]|uniref:type VI secretion system contractile sheath small subunit n=1 Tax=Pseudochrobactrum sp. HB0163 TaxID=3450708 RepID=UPI003F6E0E2A